jgi:hypothetical protein
MAASRGMAMAWALRCSWAAYRAHPERIPQSLPLPRRLPTPG